MSREQWIFWRERYQYGEGGAFIRAQSINTTIAQYIKEGIDVAGIIIDPENESNVELILWRPEETMYRPESEEEG